MKSDPWTFEHLCKQFQWRSKHVRGFLSVKWSKLIRPVCYICNNLHRKSADEATVSAAAAAVAADNLAMMTMTMMMMDWTQW